MLPQTVTFKIKHTVGFGSLDSLSLACGCIPLNILGKTSRCFDVWFQIMQFGNTRVVNNSQQERRTAHGESQFSSILLVHQ